MAGLMGRLLVAAAVIMPDSLIDLLFWIKEICYTLKSARSAVLRFKAGPLHLMPQAATFLLRAGYA
jgi:hypothetical protein